MTSIISALRTYLRLPRARRALVREAMREIRRQRRRARNDAPAAIRATLANPSTSSDVAAAEVRELAWAVRAVAPRIRGSKCLDQALALHAMAARRGLGVRLHVGARVGAEGFQAHAWVTCKGAIVLGDRSDLSDYRAFPLERLRAGEAEFD